MGSPLKNLSFGLKKKSGHNNLGHFCVFTKGKGKKRKYRIIDFKRSNINIINIPAIILRIEYDPNRSSYIALICYKNGFLSYIILINGLNIGDQIYNFSNINNNNKDNLNYLDNGNSNLLGNLPMGTIISNIELKPGLGAFFSRSAGTFSVILNKYIIKNNMFVLVRLSSGEEYLLSEKCRVVIGIVSNIEHRLKNWKKAGTSVNKGMRPSVRGVAMNPIDHPHGGGEGKKSPRVGAMSPWGKLTKGIKTRKKNIINNFILKRRK